MIAKNILLKANSQWVDFLETISKLSVNEKTHEPLVVHDFKMYNFDKITKQLHNYKKYPSSTDALFITDKVIEFIEFKSGFKQKLTKATRQDTKAKCDELFRMINKTYVCNTFWGLFWKNQDHERQILIDSIRLKSVESYITLEKKVFNTCDDLDGQQKIKVKLTVVIDENEISNYENVLGEMSGKPASEKNCFFQIKKALDRVSNQKDSGGYDYLYDEIAVVSTTDFLNRLKLITTS